MYDIVGQPSQRLALKYAESCIVRLVCQILELKEWKEEYWELCCRAHTVFNWNIYQAGEVPDPSVVVRLSVTET